MQLSDVDPAQLIYESYRIKGISAPECRSIFLDWALKLPESIDQRDALALLIDTYRPGAEDHPMSVILQEALGPSVRSGRRGGRRARLAEAGENPGEGVS